MLQYLIDNFELPIASAAGGGVPHLFPQLPRLRGLPIYPSNREQIRPQTGTEILVLPTYIVSLSTDEIRGHTRFDGSDQPRFQDRAT